MKKAGILSGILLLGIVSVLVAAQGDIDWEQFCPSGELDLKSQNGGIIVRCFLAAVPTPTSTPVSAHDDRAWHPVSDAIGHEHKDDPHDADDVFGNQFYLWAGGEISYPWETPRENELKHNGYGWMVRKGASGDVSDFRYQYHAIMSAHGAITRFHSFWLEANVCKDGQCGIIRTGGWMDYGILNVNGIRVPLPNDPDPVGGFPGQREHTSYQNHVTWYAAGKGRPETHEFVVTAIRTNDAWGPVNPDNPSEIILTCPDYKCRFNGSNIEMEILDIQIQNDEFDGVQDGIVNYSGYTDRYGNIVEGCTEIELNCIPLEIEGVIPGMYLYRDDNHGLPKGKDFDISPPGEWWITYPN